MKGEIEEKNATISKLTHEAWKRVNEVQKVKKGRESPSRLPLLLGEGIVYIPPQKNQNRTG